jgi:hypothetical protein
MQDKLAAHWPHSKAIPGNAPSDVEQVTSCCRQQVEMKTLLSSKRGHVRISSAAMARKLERLQQEPPPVRRLWTIAYDHREHYANNSLDKATAFPLFIREGAGSFNVKSMHKVNSAGELEKIVKTPPDKLPEAAKPPTTGFYADWMKSTPKQRQTMAASAYKREQARIARRREKKAA